VQSSGLLTLNKMAPERPLSRMAIEILCPCLAWELVLFCAAPQVPHLWHQYLKICKWATFLNVLKIIIYKNRRPINFKFANCIRASSRAKRTEGRGAVSIGTGRMARGTICPCWSSVSWELALFVIAVWLNFPYKGNNFALAGLVCHGNLLCFVITVWFNFHIFPY
jgi:hypothetical protein